MKTSTLVGAAIAITGGAIVGAWTDNFWAGTLTAVFIGGAWYIGGHLVTSPAGTLRLEQPSL